MAAKFPGQCASCSRSISVGDQILWQAGAGARHVSCAQGAPKRAAAPARRKSSPKRAAPKMAGTKDGAVETLIRVVREQPDCAALIGRTFVAGPKAGSVAGQPVTVIGADAWYLSDGVAQDQGDYAGSGWRIAQYVRLATPEAAAPVVAAAAAASERQSLARDLEFARGERTSEPMPEGAVVVRPQTRGKLCPDHLAAAVIDDSTLVVERCGDPDRCDSWYAYCLRVTSPELVARVRALAEVHA
jgi:hypothetical protein